MEPRASASKTPIEVLRDPGRPRPLRGRDARDHPRALARRRVQRPAARRLPAARPGRARRRARADRRRAGSRWSPTATARAPTGSCCSPRRRDRPRVRRRQLRAPRRARHARAGYEVASSRSRRSRSTSTRPTTSPSSPRRSPSDPSARPQTAAALARLGPIAAIDVSHGLEIAAIAGIARGAEGDSDRRPDRRRRRAPSRARATATSLVVSQKVVSKAEGRVRELAEVEPGERATSSPPSSARTRGWSS